VQKVLFLSRLYYKIYFSYVSYLQNILFGGGLEIMSNTTKALSRIESILDDSSFVEIGALVTARNTDFNSQEKKAPSDGVITGFGAINGNPVYIYSQDASVLNGTIGEMHAKKIVNLINLAFKTGTPIIGLVDCAGIRLQEGQDALNSLGRIYTKMSECSGIIPMLTAIYGDCGGGLAVLAKLSDFTFMEEKKAKLFVNSPNALEGNYEEKLDTASAKFMSESGVVDFVGDEDYIANGIRNLISILPANYEEGQLVDISSKDDLNRVCENALANVLDPSLVLKEISDDNLFIEVKKNYAKEMVVGFISIDGITVGAIANRSAIYNEKGEKEDEFSKALTVKGAKKAAGFVKFCNALEIPIVSLTNVAGFDSSVKAEEEMAEAVAKLTYEFASADVPKINIIVGDSYGSAYVAMNSKSVGADIVYAWNGVKVGTMDAGEAVKIIYADEIKESKDFNETLSKKRSEFEEKNNSALALAKRGYLDTIIEPEYTRQYLAAAIEMLYGKQELRPNKKHGTI